MGWHSARQHSYVEERSLALVMTDVSEERISSIVLVDT
jgi:hypothetical protein